MEKGRQAGEGERERERGTKGTGQGRDGAVESDQRTRKRELDETGEMGRDRGQGGPEKGSRRKPARGLGESRGGEDRVRGQREGVQDEEDADGGGEGERQVGGGLRGEAGRARGGGVGGGGWDCGASSEREGGETEEQPGKWSAVSTALPPLAAATVSAARPGGCTGHYGEFVPSPLPPRWGGGGGREVTGLGREGEGEGNDGTDQTPRNRTCSSISPCSSEPQQRLRQRWGEAEKEGGGGP